MPSPLKIRRISSAHVGIFATDALRSILDDPHAATEATISLCQFEADISAAEHDQVWGQTVEFQCLDICDRPGSIEAGNARNRRVCSEIEENPA